MPQTATLPLTDTKLRISSIDVLRGLVMVIMALDHTREMLHMNGSYYDATNLSTTTPLLFFTRWITHYCAPTFVFLAGTAAYLSGQKKTKQELSLFLMTRGIWLLLLEVTIVNFGIWFDVTFSFIILQVIWTIGISMLLMAGLVFLPKRWLLAVGLAILLGHNLLDGISFEKGTTAELWWAMLHQRALINLSPHLNLFVLYPMLPWLGIMTLGYCFGELYSRSFDPHQRRKMLLRIGLAAVVGFVLIRAVNVYGDLSPWSKQTSSLFTLLSFINTTKYPPSLLYALMTLGPSILFLYLIENVRSPLLDFFAVYGRVPLFYYILHFYLIHSIAVISLLINGLSWQAINFQANPSGIPKGYGMSLGMTYVAWLLIVLSLYPLCKWYSPFKSRNKGWVWSYL